MAKRPPAADPSLDADNAVALLKKLSTKQDFSNLKRFGIVTNKAFGVSMANIQKVAKTLGRDHELAAALWKTGWYEARMLASFVDEPERSRRRRWIAGAATSTTGAFATRCASSCSTRRRMRWRKVAQMERRGRRSSSSAAAFALLASLALHDKNAADAAVPGDACR